MDYLTVICQLVDGPVGGGSDTWTAGASSRLQSYNGVYINLKCIQLYPMLVSVLCILDGQAGTGYTSSHGKIYFGAIPLDKTRTTRETKLEFRIN